MPAGALPYINALTDTRRCLSCTIIIRNRPKYVNLLWHSGMLYKIYVNIQSSNRHIPVLFSINSSNSPVNVSMEARQLALE